MGALKSAGLIASGTLLSGLLLALSLPPISWGFGAICLVPVLYATVGCGAAVGFGAGMAVSLIAAFSLAKGFLVEPSVMDGDPGWIYTGFALFGLMIGLVMLVRGATPRLARRPWAMAAWATLLEVPLLVYLPAHLGLTQGRSTVMLEICAWTGLWGVSFLVWWANFQLSEWLIERRSKHCIALTACIALSSLSWLPAERGDFLVAAMQTRSGDLDELASLNAKAGEMGARLVVWPELSGLAIASGGRTSGLIGLAKQPDQPPFVTTFPDDAAPKPHNAAALFSPAGESKRYWKRKPFAAERQMHEAGSEPASAEVDGHTFALCICFDSCFPAVIRASAKEPRVEFLVLPSLDPDTPRGIAQALHGAWTPFRAAESGLPIIRSEITAWSQVTDARGRMIAEAPPGQGVVITGGIRPGQRWTFYRLAGDWFLGLAVVLALLGTRRAQISADASGNLP